MTLELTVFYIIVLVFSIILHEVSHGYAADMLGDPTARLQGRLTLNPVPHIDVFGSLFMPALLVLTSSPIMFGYAKPVPYNPYNLRNQRWGEAIVAGAGPLTNIALAVIFGLGIRFADELGLPSATVMLLAIITHVNILLALFNMIPIPPLDGSKVLMSVLPYQGQLAMRRFEEMFMQYALVGFVLFIALFYTILSGPLALFINLVFVLITGTSLY